MIHLTLTGLYAGRPLCDCDKEKAIMAGDEFTHFMYAPKSVLESPDLCPKCKAELDASEDDDK